MRRAIFLLIFMLLLQLLVPVHAEQNEEINEKYEILSALNIVTFEYGTGDITRNEFIGAVCRMIKAPVSDSVYEEAWTLGLTQSEHEKSFRGNDAITGDEAATVAVTALGYGHFAKANGGYPGGYVSCAGRLGVFKHIKNSTQTGITYSDAIEILYNIMNCDVAQVDEIGEKNISIKAEPDVTLLSLHRNIYCIEGSVKDNGITAVNAHSRVAYGEVMIGDLICSIGTVDIAGFLGKQVEAFVQEVDDEYTLIWIEADEKNQQISVDSEDILGVNEDFSYFTFEDEKKVVKKRLSSALRVIYNEVWYDDYTQEDFMPEKGTVTLLDSDGDGSYETVFINDYEYVLTDYISDRDGKLVIRNKFGEENVTIDTEHLETVISIRNNGADVLPETIGEWDLLMIRKSKNVQGRMFVGIEVVKNQVTGIVTQISLHDKYVVIDGIKYDLSAKYIAANQTGNIYGQSFVVGQTYICHLDGNGAVVAVRESAKNFDYEYAYIIKAVKDDEVDDTFLIKTMDMNGIWSTAYLAKTVRYNEERVEKKVAYNLLTGEEKITPQIIMLKKNSNGEINGIKTAEITSKSKKDKLTVTPVMELCYNGSGEHFGSKVYIGNNPKFLLIPDETSYQEEDYEIRTSYLEEDTTYKFSAVDMDEFGFANLFIMERKIEDELRRADFRIPFVVKKRDLILNEDDEPRNRLTGDMGDYRNYTIMENAENIFSDIKKGDMLSYITNNRGYVTNVKTLYSLDDYGKLLDGGQINTTNALYSGYVVNYEPQNRRILLNCGTERSFRIDANAYVHISESGKVEDGSQHDIGKGDYVVMWLSWGFVREIMVIR